MERYEVQSTRSGSTGQVELKLAFDNEGKALGGPATVRLFINGEACGKSYPQGPPHFPFTGTIDKVRFDFGDGVDQSPAEKLEQHLKMD